MEILLAGLVSLIVPLNLITKDISYTEEELKEDPLVWWP